jgi:deoxycytidine triphosphate deaminase
MMDWGYLVTDGDPNNITGAAYDLNLGDEYYYDGESHPLDDQHEFINLEPHEYVLVRSKETINLPKDIAARFGIKVGLFLQGLIQSNGPQIDPGFTGVLWCLLFNTSGDTVKLKRGKHYSTIEFCRLQSPTTAYTGEHLNHERIMQYLPSTPSRSPIKKLRDDVDSLQREGFWAKFGPLFFSLIIAAAALTMAILSYIKK